MWDIYTQGVASLCPGLSACYPFRELTLQDYPAGQVFIFVYRLAIDARPERVMVGLAENIQACLRIFRRAQHQWLARDILHLPPGVFIVFVLHPPHDPQDRSLTWHSAAWRAVRQRMGNSPPGEGYRCGSRGAFLYCQRQLFCFVAFRQPAGQTRKVVRFRQASLLAWMNITTWL